MAKITDLAKGKSCQIRLYGVCNGNDATTIFAHYRAPGLAGVGIKPNDLIGSWACSSCHDAIDGRVKTKYTHEELELSHLQGMTRTIKEITNNYTMQLKLRSNRKGMF